MIDPERPANPDAAVPGCNAGTDLTHVDLTWLEKRVEQWLRFGTPAQEHRIDRRRRVLSFVPGVTFALVRWAANDVGTVLSRLDVVRTTMPGAALQTLPLVRPGGTILLRAEGWPKVERVLCHIDTIEAAGIDPAVVDPDHWRHLHNRIAAGQESSDYTSARHQAWLKRRRIGA